MAVLIGFVLYLAAMLAIGAVLSGRNKTQQDYFLGGRKLGAWVIALSERASGESAWLLLGLSGAVLSVGLGEVWAALGCLGGIVFSWLFIARRLREDSEKYGALTLPDYLAKRFGKGSKAIQVIASIIIIFFFTFYVAAQFSGAGKVLNMSFGIDYHWGVLIGAGIILLYTVLGGFFAVAWTDMIQAIIMFGTLVILPLVGFMELAGTEQGFGAIGAALEKAGDANGSFVGGKTGWAAILLYVVAGLSWGLGYTGQPHLLLRYLAMKDPADTRKAMTIAFVWAFPAFIGAFLIGVVGIALVDTGSLGDVEQLMPMLAMQLLPSWLAGVFLSGAIAAMMSTADSQILVVTSAVTEDIYHRVLGKEPGEKTLVWISRGTTLVMGIFAIVLALSTKDFIFSMVSYAWGGLGASFGPVIVLALYWRRLNGAGVIAGLLTGSISTIVWKNVKALQQEVPERLVAYVLAFAMTIVVTLITSRDAKADAPADASR